MNVPSRFARLISTSILLNGPFLFNIMWTLDTFSNTPPFIFINLWTLRAKTPGWGYKSNFAFCFQHFPDSLQISSFVFNIFQTLAQEQQQHPDGGLFFPFPESWPRIHFGATRLHHFDMVEEQVVGHGQGKFRRTSEARA